VDHADYQLSSDGSGCPGGGVTTELVLDGTTGAFDFLVSAARVVIGTELGGVTFSVLAIGALFCGPEPAEAALTQAPSQADSSSPSEPERKRRG
jgi:hypothetical protein